MAHRESFGVEVTKFFGTLILAAASLATVHAESPYEVKWVRQLGTAESEEGYGAAVDNLNNVFVTGRTRGSLGGPNAGTDDVFIAKYSAAGDLAWVRQMGSAGSDWGCSVSTDPQGNAYIGGYTFGNLGGGIASQQDAFVAKYDATGHQEWVRQFAMKGYNPCFGVSTDSGGNVYATGKNYDYKSGVGIYNDSAFLRKYSPSGNVQWTSQVSLAHSNGTDVTTDVSGNVYVAGETDSPSMVFVAKYDSSGKSLWTRQVGDWATSCGGVVVNQQGDLYVSGSGYYNQNTGHYDAFLAKYDANGNQQWNRKFDAGDDTSYGLAIDPHGDVYLNDGGGQGPVLAKYDPAGNLVMSLLFGIAADDMSYSCAADASGSVFVTGFTGRFGSPNTGGQDIYVAKLGPVPEPSTFALLGAGAIGLIGYGLRRRRRSSLARG